MKLLLLLCACALIAPAETAADLLEQKTIARIGAIDSRLNGILGVYAIDLTTGHAFGYHSDTVFTQASSIKIPILVELFRQERAGTVHLDQTLTLNPNETVGGSGELQHELRRGPIRLTVLQLATAMIEVSDNTATNKIIGMLGMDNVNNTMQKMGFPHTRLQRIMLDNAAAAKDRENISTPREMAELAARIYRGEAVDAKASAEMIRLLKMTDPNNFRPVIPGEVEVASKPGETDGVHCETGLVFVKGRPFALAVMGAYLDRGVNPVGEVAAEVFAFFDKLARHNSYGHRVQ